MSQNDLVHAGSSGFAIAKRTSEEVHEVIRANCGESGVSPLSLDRVTIPAGGGLAWTVATLDGDRSMDAIEGVIVCWQDVRVYYDKPFDGEKVPPTCSSADGKLGIGKPGGVCVQGRKAVCPFAEFGSDPKGGPGQACKQCRRLFIVQKDDILPIIVTLPPTSLGACSKYFLRLAKSSMAHYAIVTRLALTTDKSASGIKYSKVELSTAEVMVDADRVRFRDLNSMFGALLSGIPAEAGDYNDDGHKQD